MCGYIKFQGFITGNSYVRSVVQNAKRCMIISGINQHRCGLLVGVLLISAFHSVLGWRGRNVGEFPPVKEPRRGKS